MQIFDKTVESAVSVFTQFFGNSRGELTDIDGKVCNNIQGVNKLALLYFMQISYVIHSFHWISGIC